MKHFLTDKAKWLLSILLDVNYRPVSFHNWLNGFVSAFAVVAFVGFWLRGGPGAFLVSLLFILLVKISYSYKPHVKEEVRPSGPTAD